MNHILYQLDSQNSSCPTSSRAIWTPCAMMFVATIQIRCAHTVAYAPKRAHEAGQGIPVIQDPDEYSTDLMKCLESLQELEKDGRVRTEASHRDRSDSLVL